MPNISDIHSSNIYGNKNIQILISLKKSYLSHTDVAPATPDLLTNKGPYGPKLAL